MLSTAAANRSSFSPELSRKIDNLCRQQAVMDALQGECDLYIPISGSCAQNSQQVFDLASAVDIFLDSDKKFLLLLGEPGSGKTIFSQILIMNQARRYQPGGAIPLFISLPTIVNPLNQLMQEALSRYKFSPQEIEMLKQTQRFLLVFDAFDELGLNDIYLTNHLDTWQAKIIFTSQASYVNRIDSYHKLFMSNSDEKQAELLIQKIYLAPFAPQQIDSYIEQYFHVRGQELEQNLLFYPDFPSEFSKAELNPKSYRDWIKKIPGLEVLAYTPFLLRIITERLLSIVTQYQEAHNQQSVFKMTEDKLYEIFMRRWFSRQEDAMVGRGEPCFHGFQRHCMSFAKALAKKNG